MSVFLALGVFLVSSQIAQADPHAVFYTVSGQQQLFFNMLAALDQADYVEPATPTVGSPEDGSRSELLEDRETAGFGRATDPVLVATQTDLASLLTRNITLEGNDLWSSYLALQFALESTRRRNSAELIKIFCGHGLGLKDCKQGKEDTKIADLRRENAFETSGLNIISRALTAIDASLFSGTPYDQQDRYNLATKENDSNKNRPYNPGTAALRDAAGNDVTKQVYVDSLAQSAANVSSSYIDSSALDKLSFDENGRIATIDTDDTRGSIELLSAIFSMPDQFFKARIVAEDEQALIDSTKLVGGVKADTYAVAQAAGDRIGQINEQVRLPATAKSAEIAATLQTIGEVNAHPDYVGTQENVPGNVQLVDRSGQSAGQTAGISSDRQLPVPNKARVLAETTDEDIPDEDTPAPEETFPPSPTPQAPIPRDSNPVGFIREKGVLEFLEYFIGVDVCDSGPQATGSGATCGSGISLQSVIYTYNPTL